MTIVADSKKIHKVIVEAKIPSILFFIFTHPFFRLANKIYYLSVIAKSLPQACKYFSKVENLKSPNSQLSNLATEL